MYDYMFMHYKHLTLFTSQLLDLRCFSLHMYSINLKHSYNLYSLYFLDYRIAFIYTFTMGAFDLNGSNRMVSIWHQSTARAIIREQVVPKLSNGSRVTLMSYTDHSIQRRLKSNIVKVLILYYVIIKLLSKYIYIYNFILDSLTLAFPVQGWSSQVELYCYSATWVYIQWNETSCLTGPRCYCFLVWPLMTHDTHTHTHTHTHIYIYIYSCKG